MEEDNIANREEADKCKEMAKQFLSKGECAKAIKFFDKSLRLYPLPGVVEMKARAEKMLAGEGSPRSAPTSGSLPRTDSASSSSGQTRGFTPEQEAGAKKILLAAKKSHYEVLGIARDADEDAIKRAYKKLALKFHPDKNSAPSAEAAFKAISTANDTLGDLQKREIYDQVGHDAAMNNNGMDGGGGGFPGGFHGFRRGGGGGVHVHEINPEDIFNLFFQGGVPGGMQGAFRTHMPQQRARPQYTEERRSGSFVMQLLQFLPIIALFVMSMSSLGGTGQPAYSFRQSNVHMEARKTGPNSVFRGVPYYVTPSFDRSFPPQSYSLQRLERDISLEYREILATECQKERQRRGVNIYKTKWSTEADKEKAKNTPTPSCDQYQQLFAQKTSTDF